MKGWSIDGEADAVEAIYHECEIQSRTELNGNKEAQDKFDVLISDYEKWGEEDEPF
jgi:hypothetical protein